MNLSFSKYLDSIYGDKLSLSDKEKGFVDGIVDSGIIFDVDKNSWVVVHERYGLNTSPNQCSAWKISVVEDKTPYDFTLRIEMLKRI